MNYFCLVGTVARKPELSTTKSGAKYVPLRIATRRRTRQGENLQYFTVLVFDALAELVCAADEGDPICISGRLDTRQDPSGEGRPQLVLRVENAEVWPSEEITEEVEEADEYVP